MTRLIYFCLFAVSMVLGKPSKNQALDKATDTDVVVNSVNSESKSAETIADDEKIILPNSDGGPNRDVYVADLNFGSQTTNYHKPGATVARIIDDIFQIPIGVLQSVARLLRNPFIAKEKTPEATRSY